ncbi:MAG: MFS transporter [Eggerthellales bacterium]|nr:MFS transporter [Eggerthellales bacterium]
MEEQAQTTSSEAKTSPEQQPSPNQGYSWLLMAGHLCSDVNQGALLASLPFLVLYSGFSYTAVSLLILAANVASSVIQPLFGWLGDKKARPWLMALGIFLAGAGMAGVGLFSNYYLVLASAMVSGIGVAMFHPEGGRLANLVAGKKKAGGMSIFSVGGNLGFTTGPIIAAASLSAFGLAGTAVFLIPSTLCALVLLTQNKKLAAFGLRDQASVDAAGGKDHWGAFSLILGVLSFRSVLFNTLLTFVPLFLVGVLGQSEAFGSLAITAYSLVGAIATLLSGRISAKTGAQKLLLAGMAGLALIMVGFSFCHLLPSWAALPVALLLLLCAAPAVNAPYPSTVALGQGFIPNHLGMASGLTYGIAVSVGGVISPLMGMVGDAWGLTYVFALATVFALVGSAIALILLKMSRNLISR